MPEFRLQFPIEDVPEYAARYAYEDDAQVIVHGQAARERGYYTREEFLDICRWKTSGRSGHRAERNSEERVKELTRSAFAETDERKRMATLRELSGVEWPTASVLLHLALPEEYPILDRRALQALGVQPPAVYSFKFWWAYVEYCRALARQAGVDMRTLDRALWQYSKEQGVPIYRPCVRH